MPERKEKIGEHQLKRKRENAAGVRGAQKEQGEEEKWLHRFEKNEGKGLGKPRVEAFVFGEANKNLKRGKLAEDLTRESRERLARKRGGKKISPVRRSQKKKIEGGRRKFVRGGGCPIFSKKEVHGKGLYQIFQKVFGEEQRHHRRGSTEGD